MNANAFRNPVERNIKSNPLIQRASDANLKLTIAFEFYIINSIQIVTRKQKTKEQKKKTTTKLR